MSKSQIQEFIGILWFILFAILHQGGASKWVLIPILIHATVCMIAAVILAIRQALKEVKARKVGEA